MFAASARQPGDVRRLGGRSTRSVSPIRRPEPPPNAMNSSESAGGSPRGRAVAASSSPGLRSRATGVVGGVAGTAGSGVIRRGRRPPAAGAALLRTAVDNRGGPHRRGREPPPVDNSVSSARRSSPSVTSTSAEAVIGVARLSHKARHDVHTRRREMDAAVRLRPAGDRLRARRAEGRDRRGQARQAGGGRRAARHDGRGLRQHGHDPVEDAARGRPLPHRLRAARHVRRELPGEVRDHHRRPAGAHPARRRARGRGHPQPAAAQPRRHPRRHRALRRPAHRQRRRATARGDHHTVTAENIVIATGHQARPAVARSSSTTSACSTPTACCSSSRCPTRWSSSAPA